MIIELSCYLESMIKVCISSLLSFEAHVFLSENKVLTSGHNLLNDVTAYLMTSLLSHVTADIMNAIRPSYKMR